MAEVTQLEVRWDPGRRYRAFVQGPRHTATIVSSQLADDAQGYRLGGVLIVTDREGFVCDLELRLDDEHEVAGYELPQNSERLAGPLTTAIEIVDSAPVVSVTGDWLLVRFRDSPAGRWHRLADEPVFLLLADSKLLTLAAHEPRADPEGLTESQWLDEIEIGAAAQDRTRPSG